MNTINPSQLPQVRWQNQNVITTELLAQCYGAQEKQIRQNFANNKSRFEEGKHFFKLEGEALKNLRVDEIDSQISSKARSLILWTEKGAARHSKILDTEKAWDMFDQLEEAYFHTERRMTQSFKLSFTPEELEDLVTSRINESSVSLQSKYIALLEQENSRLKAAEVPEYHGKYKRWTQAEDAIIREKRKEGWGAQRIHHVLDRSAVSVQHRIRRLGV